METKSHKDLIVWQKSMDLVERVCALTGNYPQSEKFGLTSQMRRAVISIPSNIAEGRRRGTKKDYRQFLITAYSSGSELETQLEISKRLGFAKERETKLTEGLLTEVMKMLATMIRRMKW